MQGVFPRAYSLIGAGIGWQRRHSYLRLYKSDCGCTKPDSPAGHAVATMEGRRLKCDDLTHLLLSTAMKMCFRRHHCAKMTHQTVAEYVTVIITNSY